MTDFSYQLYSSRNFAPLPETLKMIAGLGYAQAEGWGGLYASPDAVEALKSNLSANGLTMPTGHVGFEQMRDDRQIVIDFAKDLGMQAVIAPVAPGLDTLDLAGWEAFAAEMNEVAKPLQDAGLTVGYHNHHWEFMDKGGSDLPIEIVLNRAPSISFEMDVAWVVRGGHDPLEWIDRYKDRLIAAHVKDIAPEGTCEDEDGWADVGQGTMPWSDYMSALRGAGVSTFVMEHDNPSDDRRFAERSIAAAQKL